MHADLRPAALLALRAPMTVLADSRPTALLALRALTTVRTSAAHLASRPGLHPVLARPLRARGSFTLRALLRHLLFPALRVLDFAIFVERDSHVRSPERRPKRHEVGAPRDWPETPAPGSLEQRYYFVRFVRLFFLRGRPTGIFGRGPPDCDAHKRFRPTLWHLETWRRASAARPGRSSPG